MTHSHRVRARGSLLDALQQMFQGRSRRDLRRLLRDGRIQLNGIPAADSGAAVAEGDVVTCTPFGRPRQIHPRVLLVHEDEHLLVVDKDAGILTSEGVPGKLATVQDVLHNHLRRRGLRCAVFPCHRLDRAASGLLAFAKDPVVAATVRSDPRRYLRERVYHALVEGVPEPREGTITACLREGEDQAMHIVTAAEGGKRCVTHYRVLEAGEHDAVLEVRLETGRKHQIRAHLSHIGHPVAGDEKYGARTNPARRLALHARRLVVLHPVTGETLEFESPPPAAFSSAR